MHDNREIMVVGADHIHQGRLNSRGRTPATASLSLVDLLSNPSKTLPGQIPFGSTNSLLHLVEVTTYHRRRDSYSRQAGIFIPVPSILFAFETEPGLYRSDPDFKLQADMEQNEPEHLEIGIGEYIFTGWVRGFLSRYSKQNLDFLAITGAALQYTTSSRMELRNRPFYALNKRKIDYVAPGGGGG